jgi:hypothetical protein
MRPINTAARGRGLHGRAPPPPPWHARQAAAPPPAYKRRVPSLLMCPLLPPLPPVACIALRRRPDNRGRAPPPAARRFVVPGRRRAKSSYPGPPGRRAEAIPPVRMARDPPEHRRPCVPDPTAGADVPKIRSSPSVSTRGEQLPEPLFLSSTSRAT